MSTLNKICATLLGRQSLWDAIHAFLVQLRAKSAVCVCVYVFLPVAPVVKSQRKHLPAHPDRVAPTGHSPLHLSPTRREHGTISNCDRNAAPMPLLSVSGSANHSLIQCSKAHSAYVHISVPAICFPHWLLDKMKQKTNCESFKPRNCV